MSRLIPHNDMTAVQLADCCRQAWAIMRLCELAAWSLQQQDTLESHEGLKGDATEGGDA